MGHRVDTALNLKLGEPVLILLLIGFETLDKAINFKESFLLFIK
jgi:hypothetical protein